MRSDTAWLEVHTMWGALDHHQIGFGFAGRDARGIGPWRHSPGGKIAPITNWDRQSRRTGGGEPGHHPLNAFMTRYINIGLVLHMICPI